MGLYIVADVGKGPIAAEISEVDLDFGPRLCAMTRLISRKHGRHFVVRSAGPEIVDIKAAPQDWAGDLIAYVDRSALSVAVQACRKRIDTLRIDRYLDRQRAARLPDLFEENA
ncbi:hypothetical protein [Bosea minatitlanensis]|jgi:hypothetical protein|uniref:Uncharacterized protein n=2 Tax=Pseudomonadota TaxID=1224 RepID=A0ABW0F0R7_9HYPH|nr:hypothetical protein [Bosea minatitlanensis]MCT4493953.1 hypothetical protein [Bosea minatitlanensis]